MTCSLRPKSPAPTEGQHVRQLMAHFSDKFFSPGLRSSAALHKSLEERASHQHLWSLFSHPLALTGSEAGLDAHWVQVHSTKQSTHMQYHVDGADQKAVHSSSSSPATEQRHFEHLLLHFNAFCTIYSMLKPLRAHLNHPNKRQGLHAPSTTS